MHKYNDLCCIPQNSHFVIVYTSVCILYCIQHAHFVVFYDNNDCKLYNGPHHLSFFSIEIILVYVVPCTILFFRFLILCYFSFDLSVICVCIYIYIHICIPHNTNFVFACQYKILSCVLQNSHFVLFFLNLNVSCILHKTPFSLIYR